MNSKWDSELSLINNWVRPGADLNTINYQKERVLVGIAVLSRLSMLGGIFLCLSLSSLTNASEQQSDMASIKQEHCEESNNLENTFCMSRELKESDTRLNVIYKTLMYALAKPQGLQSAQRAWLVFRDAECKFQNKAMHGGSAYHFSMDLCLMQLTEQRISALETVRPCNGCVEFKDAFYKTGFNLPERKRTPASGKL
ncbi:lysozyme inhibitor LprI family protein [Janthinobacterium sp. SUN211]|uniref:lysozyme inhibitor LprI family protein n=1 Tax=Janthinobacterium sp. SUN211 TaxID=3014786 RepID=UPI002713A0A3|nr:lysozyme inhibitor LprI family protein [Janthinobacterium sp. SUN211]MDO8050505.1 lysozyme inhibitor LprI family protein [Janthinobacterium sp. SUN211]